MGTHALARLVRKFIWQPTCGHQVAFELYHRYSNLSTKSAESDSVLKFEYLLVLKFEYKFEYLESSTKYNNLPICT